MAQMVMLLLLLLSGDVETNPGPNGNKLTLDDLGQVMEEIVDVSAKWYHLGVQLKLRTGTLDSIRKQFSDPKDQLLEMLKTWLTNNDNTSWKTLADGLRSRTVEASQLANTLGEKYRLVEGTEANSGLSNFIDSNPKTDVTPPPPVSEQVVPTPQPGETDMQEGHCSSCDSTPLEAISNRQTVTMATVSTSQEHTVLLNQQEVAQKVEQLEKRFLELAFRTYEELKVSRINVDSLHAWLVSLDVFKKCLHQEFIEKFHKEKHLNDAWQKLCNYWNFLNFDLLEHVVSKFGSENLKKEMESYEHELQLFLNATRVRDFFDCLPAGLECLSETELKKFVAKVNYNWDKCTLKDLDTLQKVIIRKFFLPKFALRLRKIMEGCVTIVWLIPVLLVEALQKAVETAAIKFFMEQKIETITIDGKVCYSASSSYSDYFHRSLTSTFPSESSISSRGSISGFSSKSSISGFSSGFSSRSSISGFSSKSSIFDRSSQSSVSVSSESSGYSSGSSRYAFSSRQSSYASKSFSSYGELDPLLQDLPPAEKYVKEKCVDEVSQHVKLLQSVEQYLSKAEVEADPSLPTKYKDYLSSTPAIRAALYTTFNAKMSAEVFTWVTHTKLLPPTTKLLPPTTMTELLTAFTLKTLENHLSTHPVYQKQQLKVPTLSDLPADVHKQFQGLCRMAYDGILNKQLVFSAAHLPTEFASLGLVQEVPQQYTKGRGTSYHFIHFTLQEFLAAAHVSLLPLHDQTKLVQEHFCSDRFKMTIRFLAGLPNLINIPPNFARRLINSDNTKLVYFHFLFEAQDISVTTKSLGLDEVSVHSHSSWTPLDYYVIGHTISHSNCPWKLNFSLSSTDGEQFELFCQGCATPGGTGCKGYISHADFSGWASKMQSFENIPQRILQHSCTKL